MLAPTKAILLMFFAYFVGSIPFGYIVAAFYKNVDIREHGSGNIGMTNVFRVLGPGPGLLTLFLDVFKGWLVAKVAITWLTQESIGDYFLWGCVICIVAFLAVIGHSYPVWLRFNGGKSVAVSLGVLSVIIGWWALVPFGVFLITTVASRYVSLGSILSGVSLPVIFLVIIHSDMVILPHQGNASDNAFLGLSIILAILVILRHTANIKRLISGNENRIGSRKSKVTMAPEASPRIDKKPDDNGKDQT